MDEIKGLIIKYLIGKGMIKACLLHKLLIYYCSSNSKFIIKKGVLLSCLLSLVKERKLDIIIVEPFDINWKVNTINKITYLNDGEYYKRAFQNWNYPKLHTFAQKNYLFDSRIINFKNKIEVKKSFEWLLEIIKKKKKIKYKTIIYYPHNSNDLNIHETLDMPFSVSFNDIEPPIHLLYQGPKLSFKLEEQVINLSIIKAFRSKYMCFYITLIETIHQKIIKLQEEYQNTKKYPEKLQEYIKKFAYYCINFVKSDWVNIKKSNPYRWETIFKLFKIPFKILALEFKTIRFHGRTFETLAKYKFCINIKNNYPNIISHLLEKGYEKFKGNNEENFTDIGLEQEIYVPCPSIEYFYFVFKYICFFQLFLLFYHSFDYINELDTRIRLSSKEKMLFELFFPVMNKLFNVSKDFVSKSLVFKYYTLNPDELEVIYTNIMVNNIKIIETKMMKYFLMKHSMCNNIVNI